MNNQRRKPAALELAAILFAGCSTNAIAQNASTQVYLPATPQATQQGDVVVPKGDPEKLLHQVMAEANARAQAGQPAEDVDAWLAEQLSQAGMTVEAPPPAWDVFQNARWELENPGADSGDNAARGNNEIATIDGFNSRKPVDGRYEQEEATNQAAAREEADEASATGAGQAQEARNAAERGAAGGFFVYADQSDRGTRQRSATQTADGEGTGRTTGERQGPGDQVDRNAAVESGLRSGSRAAATSERSPAAGADTD